MKIFLRENFITRKFPDLRYMFHDYTFAAVTSRLYIYSPFDDLTVALSAMSIPKSFKYFRSSRPKKICIVGWDRWAVLEIMEIHTTLMKPSKHQDTTEDIQDPRLNLRKSWSMCMDFTSCTYTSSINPAHPNTHTHSLSQIAVSSYTASTHTCSSPIVQLTLRIGMEIYQGQRFRSTAKSMRKGCSSTRSDMTAEPSLL